MFHQPERSSLRLVRRQGCIKAEVTQEMVQEAHCVDTHAHTHTEIHTRAHTHT